MDAIAKAYARRIERGAIAIEDVPAAIRPLVEAALAAADAKEAR